MTRDRPVRVGLVGLGRIADLHARAYETVDGAELVALCDTSAEALARRKERWAVERAYSDPAALLEDPLVDAVEILTPHDTHERLTVAAARAGKHVSVQKPMALTVAECDRMISACAEASVVLRVCENFVFYPPIRRARELLDDGAIGEPKAIRLKNGITLWPGGWAVSPETLLWRLDPGRGGPGIVTFDDGYHKLSVARFLLGEVERVAGWIDWTELLPGSGLRIDAPACFTWKHREGRRFGVMDVTLSKLLDIPSRYYPVDEQIEVTGEEGVLYVTRCTANMTEGPALSVYRGGEWTRHDDLEDDWAASFRGSLESFVGAVRGDREPELSGPTGRRLVQFAWACYRAAETGGWVDLDSVEGSPAVSLAPASG